VDSRPCPAPRRGNGGPLARRPPASGSDAADLPPLDQREAVGRPESGTESKWLLAGFLACARPAGGGMSATWSYDARRTRQSYYRCNTRRARGTWLCANNHTVSVAALDEDVLAQLREHVLTPERIERVVQRAIELHTASPGDTEAQQHTLRAEVRGLDRELAEFTRAVAAGASDIPALVAAMRATQATGRDRCPAGAPGRPRPGGRGLGPAGPGRRAAGAPPRVAARPRGAARPRAADPAAPPRGPSGRDVPRGRAGSGHRPRLGG
jgi:hypothetical protein